MGMGSANVDISCLQQLQIAMISFKGFISFTIRLTTHRLPPVINTSVANENDGWQFYDPSPPRWWCNKTCCDPPRKRFSKLLINICRIIRRGWTVTKLDVIENVVWFYDPIGGPLMWRDTAAAGRFMGGPIPGVTSTWMVLNYAHWGIGCIKGLFDLPMSKVNKQ